jgi:hypothetical protein
MYKVVFYIVKDVMIDGLTIRHNPILYTDSSTNPHEKFKRRKEICNGI